LLFPASAAGSLVVKDGKVRGSTLIGESITEWDKHPEYFWGRPSGASSDATTKITYSSGSNYGPSNGALVDEVKARVEVLRKSGVTGPIPSDLVTKSASGLDPHLSLAGIEIQVPRVAQSRGLPGDEVRTLVREHAEGSTLGFLGEPRVNVLTLNLALDAKAKPQGEVQASELK
jgi:K+-transporting ATPase ATPase C chain